MAAIMRSAAVFAPTASFSRSENTCQVSRVAPAPASAKLAGSAFLKGTSQITLSRSAVASTDRAVSLQVSCGESRIGKNAVDIPAGVTYTLTGQTLVVNGKLGELSRTFPAEISCKEVDGKLSIKKTIENRKARQLHGLCRTLCYNMVEGVSTGWTKRLELIGVGYRASMKGKDLQMNVGYSNPVIMELPEGISVVIESNTKVVISGRDKCEVGNFAAIVRKLRPPEPYKGKGIKYEGEYIMRKEGKSGK
jgi:large subunit ribosomal protein L6